MSGTVTVTLAGRDVKFQPPTDAQFMVVHRILDRAQKQAEDSGENRVDMKMVGQVAKILDVLDSMVVEAADRDFLEEAILDRRVDFKDLFDAFSTATKNGDPEAKPAAKRAPAKKATRGRARRAG
jgi:hypothetical protein